jgi:hypothetical protein
LWQTAHYGQGNKLCQHVTVSNTSGRGVKEGHRLLVLWFSGVMET